MADPTTHYIMIFNYLKLVMGMMVGVLCCCFLCLGCCMVDEACVTGAVAMGQLVI